MEGWFLTFQQLGYAIKDEPLSSKFLETFVDKFKRKLKNWKGKSINEAGKVILLKYALDGVPTTGLECLLCQSKFKLS